MGVFGVLLVLSWPLHVLGASLTAASPVSRVVPLLQTLKLTIEGDGRREQASYDKYQCWCEDALARKAREIASGKERVVKLQTLILGLEGEIGSHTAEIQQLGKDITENRAAQKEATQVRTREELEYNSERTESEQCIGALESAIRALTGAGAGKRTGFLEALPKAQLLSVADDVRSVLQTSAAWQGTAAKDLEVIRAFAANPEEAAGRGGLSAAQLAQNPFGDYAPHSTRIQGILKGMYDAFASSLEKADAEEATRQKAFEEFIATKEAELSTLQLTLQKQQADKASKAKLLAESRVSRRDTQAEVEAAEAFFQDTKLSCRSAAEAWSERCRLRTEELQGVITAVGILTSPEAQQIFLNASVTLLQLSGASSKTRARLAYEKLSALASKYGSLGLAHVAVEVKAGGHFDKVIVMIDHMIELIRKEEQSDIEHRDRCQNAEGANGYALADLDHGIKKTSAHIGRLTNAAVEAQAQMHELELAMSETQRQTAKRLQLRNEERSDFEQALKDDTDAIELLQQTILALTRFYRQNGIELAALQRGKQAPQYSIDPDKAPALEWSEEYTGRKPESKNVLTILAMLVDDLKMETKTGRKADAKAQAQYETDREALITMLKTQKGSYVAAEQTLAELEQKIAALEAANGQAGEKLDGEQELKVTLQHDCDWVKKDFATRRDQRKKELQGLVEAKSILAGADKGEFDDVAVLEGASS